ncbi:MAG: SDR family oxidoreductase [Elusimicrobiota bacterium]|nr:SDR family oxidoreductase [Elusimicrobiota bacterium]
MTTATRPKPPFPRQHQRRPGLEARMRPRPEYHAAEYRPAGKLNGKRALITGGDSGIGRAVAVLYAKEGADVALLYLREEERDARETQAAVDEAGRKAVLIPGDIRSPEFCRRAVERAVRELGGLDILVNNAAFQSGKEELGEISEDDWDRTFRTNVGAVFSLTKAALPHLKPGSSIINTGSVVGLRGSEKLLDYGATKGALHAFTKSLALNLSDKGIRVNCVAPGPVWTPLNVADKSREKVAHFGEKTPMGRPAQPEEVAPAFVFFASNADSSYISGEILTLLGGETLP